MEIFYNPNTISKILYLTGVAEKYRVTMDTGNDKSINVYLGEDKFSKFVIFQKGIY